VWIFNANPPARSNSPQTQGKQYVFLLLEKIIKEDADVLKSMGQFRDLNDPGYLAVRSVLKKFVVLELCKGEEDMM